APFDALIRVWVLQRAFKVSFHLADRAVPHEEEIEEDEEPEEELEESPLPAAKIMNTSKVRALQALLDLLFMFSAPVIAPFFERLVVPAAQKSPESLVEISEGLPT
ncbi:MAG: hypothetical protein ACRD7E_23930, partial [Bryobacteraceae bacterium]